MVAVNLLPLGVGEPLVPRPPEWVRGGEAQGFLAEKESNFLAATPQKKIIRGIGRERDLQYLCYVD